MSLLYEDLSYVVRGCAMAVRTNYGPGHKESLYQNAFAEELKIKNVYYKKERTINIFSPRTGKVMGSYRPDFVIDNKIIVELKALQIVPSNVESQLYYYLRNTFYELGFLINFGGKKLNMKRLIYTNDRKHWLRANPCRVPCLSVSKGKGND